MSEESRNKKTREMLEKLIAIESVSADPKRLPDVVNAAGYLKLLLKEIGFEVSLLEDGPASPLVYASYSVKDAEKTICIYGHYDVQAEDPVSEWKTAPYTLIEQDGRYWARGIADNKGHIIQNIAAIAELIENNELKNNIVFIIEGEEEKGSVHFEPFIKQLQNKLNKVDVFFITDTGMYSRTQPQLFYALRGLVYFELTVTIGERDLHSGMYGNTVPNPALIITELLGKMKDNTTAEILIPGFYDNVRTPDKKEIEQLQSIARSDEELMEEAKVIAVQSVKKLSPYLSSKMLPSLDINGMVSGYTGDGPKTIIPKTATIKFSFRLVEHQTAEEIKGLVTTYIQEHLPENVNYQLSVLSEDDPFYTDINNNEVAKAAAVLKKAFQKEPVFNRSGGSIPAAEILQRLFGKPIILTGFTLPDDNIHAPNENMDVELFWKGVEVLKLLYS